MLSYRRNLIRIGHLIWLITSDPDVADPARSAAAHASRPFEAVYKRHSEPETPHKDEQVIIKAAINRAVFRRNEAHLESDRNPNIDIPKCSNAARSIPGLLH